MTRGDRRHATCPRCDRIVAVKLDGTLFRHMGRYDRGRRQWCPGVVSVVTVQTTGGAL